MISTKDLLETIRRVVEAFEMEDGMPFAEVRTPGGTEWGMLGEEQSEALIELAGILERLEEGEA